MLVTCQHKDDAYRTQLVYSAHFCAQFTKITSPKMPQKCTSNKAQDFPKVCFANLQPSRVNVYILQT